MRVALVKPPAIQSKVRGAGFYGENLVGSLQGIANLTAEPVEGGLWRPFYPGFDLVHYLYFDLFFLTLPPFRLAKTVVTVFDLTPIVLTEHYPRGVRGEIKWQIQKRLLSRVHHIITISESAKKDMIWYLGVPKEKISVTYLAAASTYQRVMDVNTLHQVREKYSLPKKFVLYVGDVNFNKNLPKLLEAMAIVARSVECKLVMVGKSFRDTRLPEIKELSEKIRELKLKDKIIFPGYVSEEDKIALYSLAAVYVQPSIYEGFGLPIVEAMACGAPVVCGRNSSLIEVAGETAIFADMADPDDLADKILKVLKMAKSDYERLAEKSLAQSKKFSWEKTAAETHEVYQKVLAGK